MKRWMSRAALLAISSLSVVGFAVIALSRGESVGAIWVVTAALCVFTIAYRYYSQCIKTILKASMPAS